MANGDDIPLWGLLDPPGSADLPLEERIEDQGAAWRPRRVVRGVACPSLIPFRAERPNGVSAVVIPGGGYSCLMLDKEGTDVARWLNGIGVSAFVLKHRLPGEGHADGRHVPLQDAQRAVRLVRERAWGWGLDAGKIGVVGLSSGAHLAATLGAAHDRKIYPSRDAVDVRSPRPAFMALACGPFSGNARDSLIDPAQPPLSPPEKQALYDAYPVDRLIGPATPPAFLVTADDDPRVSPLDSIRLYLALRAARVPAELHVFKDGGHGFAILDGQGKPVAAWTRLCEMWLSSLGLM